MASVQISHTTVKNVLTRTSGYLSGVTSHSLQPYRGCTLGNSLCGVACYVRHNGHVTRGRAWGSFLEVRTNVDASYLANVERERRWARKHRGAFSIFLSSSTEPFLPQERKFRVTRRVLEAMLEEPPDELVLQTHSHRVLDVLDLLPRLRERCRLRVHLSIESDRDTLPGLPKPGCPVEMRFEAARQLKDEGIRTVVTVSPLLPIDDPDAFFGRIAECANAVVLDHFIGGDGSPDGGRTRRTRLPVVMEAVQPGSTSLAYRDAMVEVASKWLPGRVGVGAAGFGGRYTTPSNSLHPTILL